MGWNMNTSTIVRELCKKKRISISELVRRLAQTPRIFSGKLQRDTVSTEELMAIGDLLGTNMRSHFRCRMVRSCRFPISHEDGIRQTAMMNDLDGRMSEG